MSCTPSQNRFRFPNIRAENSSRSRDATSGVHVHVLRVRVLIWILSRAFGLVFSRTVHKHWETNQEGNGCAFFAWLNHNLRKAGANNSNLRKVILTTESVTPGKEHFNLYWMIVDRIMKHAAKDGLISAFLPLMRINKQYSFYLYVHSYWNAKQYF